MRLEINIEKQHLTILIVALIIVAGIGIVGAAFNPNIGHHSWEQIVLPTSGPWSGLRAESADSAPWSGITGMPAGFADGVDDTGGGALTCEYVDAITVGNLGADLSCDDVCADSGRVCVDANANRLDPTAGSIPCNLVSEQLSPYMCKCCI